MRSVVGRKRSWLLLLLPAPRGEKAAFRPLPQRRLPCRTVSNCQHSRSKMGRRPISHAEGSGTTHSNVPLQVAVEDPCSGVVRYESARQSMSQYTRMLQL